MTAACNKGYKQKATGLQRKVSYTVRRSRTYVIANVLMFALELLLAVWDCN